MYEVGSARLRLGPHRTGAASSGGRGSGGSVRGEGAWDEEGGGRGSQPRWFFGSGQLRALAEQLDAAEQGGRGGREWGVRHEVAGGARGDGLAAPGEGRPGGAEQGGEEGGGLGDSEVGGMREGRVRRGRDRGGDAGSGGGSSSTGRGGDLGPRTPVFVNTVLTPLQVRGRRGSLRSLLLPTGRHLNHYSPRSYYS